jgi:hypothetical protein
MATDLLQIIDDLAFEAEMGSAWGDEKLETALVISPSLQEIYKRLKSLGLDTKLRTGLVALSAASLNQSVAVVTRSALQHVLELARVPFYYSLCSAFIGLRRLTARAGGAVVAVSAVGAAGWSDNHGRTATATAAATTAATTATTATARGSEDRYQRSDLLPQQ